MTISDARQFSRATASACRLISFDWTQPTTPVPQPLQPAPRPPCRRRLLNRRAPARTPTNPEGSWSWTSFQSTINPLASSDVGGTAGHVAAACVSTRGECDCERVCDARDASCILPPTTLSPRARQVVVPHLRACARPWPLHDIVSLRSRLYCTIIFFANTSFIVQYIAQYYHSYCTPPAPVLWCFWGVWRCFFCFFRG